MGMFARPQFTYLLRTLTRGDKRGDLRCAYNWSRSDALTRSACFVNFVRDFHFVTSSTWHALNSLSKDLGP